MITSTPLLNVILAENKNDPDDWNTEQKDTKDHKSRSPVQRVNAGDRSFNTVLRNPGNKTKKDDTPTRLLAHTSSPESAAAAEEKKRDRSFSIGYGGRYGVQNDRMDKSAVGFDYRSPSEKHSSQIDHSRGFGGRFGLETDRMDRSALGFNHKEHLALHSSQTDYSRAEELLELKTSIKELKNKFENSVGFDAIKQERPIKQEIGHMERDMSDIQTRLQTLYGNKKKSPAKPNFLIRMLTCCGPARLGKKRRD